MVRSRRNHVGRTHAEKKLYWDTIIRVPTGPTLEDTAPIIDTTDRTTAIPEEAETATYRTTKTPSAIRKFLREKGIELLITAVLLPFLAWGGCELFRLNREVGELTSNLNNTSSEIEKAEKRFIERVEGVSFEVERLERRIDGLMDRGSHVRKNQ